MASRSWVRTYGVGGRERELVGDVDGRAPGRSTQPVLAGVHEDPVEPRLESFRVAEGRPLPPRLDERVVGHVLRLGRVAQDHPGEPIGGVQVLVGEPLERRRRGRARTAAWASPPVMSTASPAPFMTTRRWAGQKPSNGVPLFGGARRRPPPTPSPTARRTPPRRALTRPHHRSIPMLRATIATRVRIEPGSWMRVVNTNVSSVTPVVTSAEQQQREVARPCRPGSAGGRS